MSKVIGNHRILSIKKCENCKGEPPTEEFRLQDVKGEACTICQEVVSWERVGQSKPARTAKSIAKAIEQEVKESKTIVQPTNPSDFGKVNWDEIVND